MIGSLFRALLGDPQTRERFAGAGVTVRFVFADPAGEVTVAPGGVTSGGEVTAGGGGAAAGGAPAPADVTMRMKADVAHAFWLGEVTLPRALSRGDIVAEGPVTKVLGLLSLLKPAYRLYPKLAQSKGVEV